MYQVRCRPHTNIIIPSIVHNFYGPNYPELSSAKLVRSNYRPSLQAEMTPNRKPRRHLPNNHPASPQATSSPQQTAGPNHQHEASAVDPSRSNEDLNLAVLRRHWPTVLTIVHIASYCVVYLFNVTTQSWEKADIDGTLFIVHHHSDVEGEEKFSANILNRRRLENFAYELRSPDDVDLDPKFIILKMGGEDSSDMQIYGLWVFSEPAPNSTAHAHEITGHIIVECAKRAEACRKLAASKRNAQQDQAYQVSAEHDGKEVEEVEEAESVLMGRQLSLRELFGQQRLKDSSWSVHNHSSHSHSQQAQPSATSLFTSNPDTDFFQSTTTSNRTPKFKDEGYKMQEAGSRPIHVDDLFQNANTQRG
jgi:hypothetical protein